MKRYIVWAIVVGVIISLAWIATWENETIYIFPEAKAEIKKPELRKELIPICACESVGNKNKTPQHFDAKGNVILGKQNPSDTGICQINVAIHAKELKALGLDATKEGDNITFANWLYANEGSKPWDWSKPCWQ